MRDNGVGVEPEHAGRIFGMFSRVNGETEGTGIGLSFPAASSMRTAGASGSSQRRAAAAPSGSRCRADHAFVG